MQRDLVPPGLLVVGHGTRREEGRHDFLATMELIARQLPEVVVRSCYLEVALPTVPQAMADMARSGCRRLVVVPLLLCAAGHAKRDIPEAVTRAAQECHVQAEIAPHLGCHPSIVQLSARRFQTAARTVHATPDQLLLLMVGRGSRDPDATAELATFVQRRLEVTPVARVLTAFLSMATPSVDDVLPEIAASPLPTVVVQPHLLYPGELLARLARTVKRQDRQSRRQQWILADCLGCDQAIASAVADRYLQAVAPSRVPPDRPHDTGHDTTPYPPLER